jgi:HAD superfamily hydrolase (TIGR01548 family)
MELLIFDMDGVLTEVSESYRESVVQCVLHFTGQRVSRDRIQEYKNQGGWNNDWDLSQKITADFGVHVPHDDIVTKFNEFFLGTDGDGLVLREQWFPQIGLLDRLAARFQLGIFTGRLQYEADISLRRFAPSQVFDPMICADHVARAKPAPDGLLAIAARHPGQRITYVGDTVDDARSAADAGVPFIGIAAAEQPHRDELLALFAATNAVAVIENINEIEGVL